MYEFSDTDYRLTTCGPLPARIRLSSAVEPNDQPQLYIPRVYCHILVSLDDDGIVGYSNCSNCGNHMDIFDKFCPHCGAKSKGRTTIREN